MYKERIQNNRNPIMLILALVGALFLTVAILDLLIKYAMVRDVLLFLLLGYAIFFLARYYLCTYQYAVIGNDLIFHRIVHGRERLVLNISIADLIGLYPYGSPKLEPYKKSKKYTLCVNKRRKQQYVGVFQVNNTPVRVVFEPTAKFVEIIQQEMKEQQSSIRAAK